MIVLSAELQAQPGCEQELETLLRTLINPVRKEVGTIAYSLSRARELSGRFFFYEKYRDQEACDHHMASSYLKAVLQQAGPLLAEAPRLMVCEEIDSISAGHSEDRYYLIESQFKKPFADFGEAVPRHRQWLQRFYDESVMLCSGPKADRTGGVMLGRARDDAALQEFLADDPYRKEGLAEYRLTEFAAAKKSRQLE